MTQESKVYYALKFIPIIFIFITTFLVTFSQISNIRQTLKTEIDKELKDILKEEKNYLKQNVALIESFIEHQKLQTRSLSESRIKERTNVALNIAENIYEKQKNRFDEEIIKQNIIEALRNIRYDSQITKKQNYYFIQEHQNEKNIITRLSPSNTSLEGQNNIDLKDENGKSFVREFYKVSTDGGGFVEYYWKKLKNNKLENSPKLSYITYFKPYNWMIGYGEYLDDMEDELKCQTIKWISSIKFPKDNYIFVSELININGGDNFSKILLNPNDSMKTKNGYFSDSVKDANGKEYRKEYLKGLKEKGEVFVEYTVKKLNSDKKENKLSYFYLDKGWNWIIAQGVYLDDVEEYVNSYKKTKNAEISEIVNNNILISLALAIIVSVIFYFVTKKLKVILDVYKQEESQRDKLVTQQAKMASMGEMIGNIAHQWRQPLSVISTIASGIKLRQELGIMENETISKDMSEIVVQTQYLSNTIEVFRNYLKMNNDNELLSLVDVLKKTEFLVKSNLKDEQIQLITIFEDDAKISGYENELLQCFINIINNAKDAIKENVVHTEDRCVKIRTKKESDKFKIIFQDNGGGVELEIIERVFEPYFTTKHQNFGTGLGLAMTYKIITEHHHGKIEVCNEEIEFNNKYFVGACFTIIFNLENP